MGEGYAIIKKSIIEENKNRVVKIEENEKKIFRRVKILDTGEVILVLPSQLKKISKDEAFIELL